MEKIYFEYLKANEIEEELEVERFWLDIRIQIYQIEKDNSLVYYNLRRGHASAYIGEYAGIFIQVLLTVIPFAEASISIWEKIHNHLKDKRTKNKIVRILNLATLENLCKYDLYTNKNIKNATLVKSEKLIDKDIEGYEPDYDFPYEEGLDKVDCARIVFENKSYNFIYTIASDGEITAYERIKK